MTLGHDTPLGHGQQFCKILLRSNKTVLSYGLDLSFPMCAFDLDLGDMIVGQGYDKPLSHGQQLCEILSKSNLTSKLWPG